MKAIKVSVQIFLFTLVFTLVGVGLYLLFPAFHPGGFLHPGAAFSASGAVSDTVIVLDAGHGGMDGGALASDGTMEKDLNLALTLQVGQILKYSGFQVILTRSDDVMLGNANGGKKKQADLAERLRIAESGEDNVFVSIHMNKFPDARCKGLQVYYSPNDPASERLAEKVQQAAAAIQAGNKRKIKPATSAIYILHRAKVPAVLIECGFLSNAEELSNLKNQEYQKELATVIAAAIMDGVINERT